MTDRDTMADVSHTPANDPSADTWFRGSFVAADGGRSETEREEERDATDERMAEVSHTSEDHEDAQGRLWKRGRDSDDDDE